MEKKESVHSLLNQAGYFDWCTSCGNTWETSSNYCDDGSCEDHTDHTKHCHAEEFDYCIPREFKLVKHWLDCDCPKE